MSTRKKLGPTGGRKGLLSTGIRFLLCFQPTALDGRRNIKALTVFRHLAPSDDDTPQTIYQPMHRRGYHWLLGLNQCLDAVSTTSMTQRASHDLNERLR